MRPWGRCMGSDCGPGGSQSRAVWCAHSEGWTTLHTNCDQSKRPDNQQSCFRVCDWHKELYDWQLGAWNQCLPVSMRNAGVQRPIVCTRGEEGIQTREVGCVLKADGEPAEDAICEYFEPKPRLEQACLIPCPRDCVVSEFSPWTQCSKTCGMGLQNRIRFVLAPPLFGGSACPNLTEFHTCQPGNCEGEESLYSLRVGPWGLCSIPVSRQARQADRQPREEGKESEKPSKEGDKPSKEGDKQSKEGDKPSKEGDKPSREGDKPSKEGDKPSREGDKPSKEGEKPSREGDKPSRESEKTSKGGDKPSREGVKVTGEGEKPSREGDRPRKDGEKRSKDADKLSKDGPKPSRPNRKLGRANRKPDRPSRQADRPKRQKKAKNKEKKEKIREKVRERLRERGKAKDPETRELIKKKRTKNRQNRPGGKFWDLTVGYQTREVSCVHKSGNVEALSFCSQDSLPITFQACVMTKDCDVTEWSDWSACSKECYDPNRPKGDRTRSRKVSQFPIDGGADCPELLEKESCSAGEEVPPCIVYSWKSTEWTECRVDVLLSQQDRRRGNQTGLCGGGLQTREVYCVQTSSETPPNLAAIRSKEEDSPVKPSCVGSVSAGSSCLSAAVIPRLDLEFVINVRRHRANRFPHLASETSPSGSETPEQARNHPSAARPSDSLQPFGTEAENQATPNTGGNIVFVVLKMSGSGRFVVKKRGECLQMLAVICS
ncbi:thrombospondin type-1 domain-containing protein 7A-like [Notothenia coriiceps]|uniref:Thrombospondin type-1 domain-containing protein 7A-like n=1 Tax=Notothenia coriiceps TaxID=8208 RepID=A0A6I9PKM8_9TELE|nr:PREDICTED: thrombospondin type-1 domain-containing protein 7A-like [Notothenia coriiceps]